MREGHFHGNPIPSIFNFASNAAQAGVEVTKENGGNFNVVSIDLGAGAPGTYDVSCIGENDGNEIAGLRSPQVSVPLATWTGWNLYAESGYQEINPENLNILKLKEFEKFGGDYVIKNKIFKGTDDYKKAISQILEVLYEE